MLLALDCFYSWWSRWCSGGRLFFCHIARWLTATHFSGSITSPLCNLRDPLAGSAASVDVPLCNGIEQHNYNGMNKQRCYLCMLCRGNVDLSFQPPIRPKVKAGRPADRSSLTELVDQIHWAGQLMLLGFSVQPFVRNYHVHNNGVFKVGRC